jgi:hypothetical protein
MNAITCQTLRDKFKNITRGKKDITDFINKQDLDKKFKNEEVEYLLHQHPNKKIIGNIEYLIVKIRPPFNKRSLYFKTQNSDEDDVSYICCLKVLFNKFDKSKDCQSKIVTAFREAINKTKRQIFFFANTKTDENEEYVGICDNCSIRCKVVVDHHQTPFQKILDDFITLNGIIIKTIDVSEINNVFILNNKDIQNKWIEYHNEIAEFITLCHSCNSSLGSYGYKKKG